MSNIRRNKLLDSTTTVFRRRGWLSVALIAGALATGADQLYAATISVPNADFSSAANTGSVGGGLIGSGSDPIGSGPWNGTYAGALGLLPPTLTINTGTATIGGLAGVNLLGILDNGGYFNQTLSTAWLPSTHYVLGADVDVGGSLGAGVLSSSNVGLALGSSGSFFTTTATANPDAISLASLSGTTYHITLTYDTAASVSGNIEVALLAEPQNILTANLLTSVTFSNVSLSGSAINPVASSVNSGTGTPQGATVDTAFAFPLEVIVLDPFGDPVPNKLVTFAAPSSGASAQLSALTATTDLNGHAHVTGVANSVAGTYTVTATVSGVATPANFHLTNLAGAAHTVGGAGGTPQSATVNTPFTTSLGVTVTDKDGNPIVGIGVTFNAPSSGASATFPSGAIAITDSSGHAEVPANANTVAGSYAITATVNGAASSATFNLTNNAGPAAFALPAGGTPQNAQVTMPFATPLSVKITDAYGNPSQGVVITFTAPTIGPSATFPPGAMPVVTATTGPDGVAQVSATANILPGPYQIVATGSGLQTQATFNLTNQLTAVPHGDPVSGGGQAAPVFGAFNCELKIKVTNDSSQPMSGVSIDFVAPASGPSATLSNGTTSAKTVSKMTDANGMAAVTATANGLAGKYAISAGVTGSGSALATYELTNLNLNDRMFSNGFDVSPDCGP